MNIFKDKIALVTGAGSGIGRALAKELARRGAHVVISDINPERIRGTAECISGSGGRVTSSTLDVSIYDDVKTMVEDTYSTHGRIDYVFNNAGIAVGGPAEAFSIEDWRKVIDVNLYGVVYGSSLALPIMVGQGFGHIVNTASIEGLVPFATNPSYVTSKYGVVGLSNALRIAVAERGVRVSVACPGFVRTAIFNDSKLIGMDRKKSIEAINQLRGITPEQCALAILRGVERNDAVIVITGFAKFIWWLHRLCPSLVMRLMQKDYRKLMKEGIILE